MYLMSIKDIQEKHKCQSKLHIDDDKNSLSL